MKKVLYILLSIVIIGSVIFGCYLIFHKEKDNVKDETNREKILVIEDVSRNCFSNQIIVYDNNTYELHKGAYAYGENPIITEGTYTYDINKIIEKIKDYPSDEKTYINYRVTVNDTDIYTVSIMEAKEINEFISSLNYEDMLWCS